MLSSWAQNSQRGVSPGRPYGALTQDWERQIETLDQKEMEIHQTQLRLIREQTATFRGDLLALRQEVNDLKMSFSKKMEVRLQEVSEAVGGHAQILQETDRRMAILMDNHEKHNRALSNHAPMKERMEYIEKLLGDSADQHAQLINDANNKLEQLHTRLSNCEVGHGDLRRAHSDKEAKHATMAERVAYLEKMAGDSADKHARELENLRQGLEKTSRDHQNFHGATEQNHGTIAQRLTLIEKAIGETTDIHRETTASVAERMGYLERVIGDSAQKHEKEIKAAHDKLERMSGHGEHIEAFKKSHAELTKNLSAHHASQEERLKYLEKLIGDSADKHNQHVQELADLKASHGKLHNDNRGHAQNHSAAAERIEAMLKGHATMEERMAYLERALGDSADKHAKEVAALKAAHNSHTEGVRGVATKHNAMQDQMEYLMKAVDDHSERHQSHAVKLEQMLQKHGEHDRHREKHASDLGSHKDELSRHRSTIEERLTYIERTVGESFETYARELESVKGRVHGDGHEIKQRHATMQDRLEYIESWLKGFRSLGEEQPRSDPTSVLSSSLRPRPTSPVGSVNFHQSTPVGGGGGGAGGGAGSGLSAFRPIGRLGGTESRGF